MIDIREGNYIKFKVFDTLIYLGQVHILQSNPLVIICKPIKYEKFKYHWVDVQEKKSLPVEVKDIISVYKDEYELLADLL